MQDALLIYYYLAGMPSAGCFRVAVRVLWRLQAVVRNSDNAAAMQRSFLPATPTLHRFFALAR